MKEFPTYLEREGQMTKGHAGTHAGDTGAKSVNNGMVLILANLRMVVWFCAINRGFICEYPFLFRFFFPFFLLSYLLKLLSIICYFYVFIIFSYLFLMNVSFYFTPFFQIFKLFFIISHNKFILVKHYL